MLPNNSDAPLTLDERKALLWIKKHQPVPWRSYIDPEAPKHRVWIRMLQLGLIHFDPHRKRFDPVRYCLSEAGRKALEP